VTAPVAGMTGLASSACAWCREKDWQPNSEPSRLHQATVAAGFQQTFSVCEAFRGPSWQLQGAGAMPAPYCLQRGRIAGAGEETSTFWSEFTF